MWRHTADPSHLNGSTCVAELINMYTSLQNTGDVEAQSQSRPAPPPRRPAYDPLNELFGGFIPERYRNILGSNVQPLALTLLVSSLVVAIGALRWLWSYATLHMYIASLLGQEVTRASHWEPDMQAPRAR